MLPNKVISSDPRQQGVTRRVDRQYVRPINSILDEKMRMGKCEHVCVDLRVGMCVSLGV